MEEKENEKKSTTTCERTHLFSHGVKMESKTESEKHQRNQNFPGEIPSAPYGHKKCERKSSVALTVYTIYVRYTDEKRNVILAHAHTQSPSAKNRYVNDKMRREENDVTDSVRAWWEKTRKEKKRETSEELGPKYGSMLCVCPMDMTLALFVMFGSNRKKAHTAGWLVSMRNTLYTLRYIHKRTLLKDLRSA